ncbi:hypothetical protein PG987_016363 [Apiospora arundinis]
MTPYPVCCTTRVPITVLGKLLTDALTGSNKLTPGSEPELAIVETQDDGASQLPGQATAPPLDESFCAYIATSVEDAAQHHVGGGSYFAVLDQQSSNDEETVLLVARRPDGTIEGTARVTFESAQIVLVSLTMATLGFDEVRSIGESQGGVYGRPAKPLMEGGSAPRKRLGG